VLDDVVAECEQRFGKLVPLAARATWDPKSRHHFALCEGWTPAPLHYRSDWWEDVGVKPDSWELIREGARRIKAKHGAVAGFGLAPELDSNMVLRGLLWSFGAHEQDEAGQVRINSPGTVEALSLMTAIFRESMTADVFSWDPSSNNRLYVYGRASIIQNAISALRTAERQNPDVARSTRLAPAAAGPQARLACVHVVHCNVVWKFAEQPELARRFLVDAVAASADAFRESEFYNLPVFARAVPDLRGRLAGDKHGGKTYGLLADAGAWSALPGHPGPVTPAIDEVVNRFVIPRMFARVAKGEQPPTAAARQAEAEMKQIFARWARVRGG
jgi:multiple sugar transport system substrate-binding protein